MAKSSKKSKETTDEETSSTAHGLELSNGAGTAAQVKPLGAKKATAKSSGRKKGEAKSRDARPRKSATGRKPGGKRARPSTASGAATVTEEQIRTRAYFISEWRMQNGIAGDSAHDWLEARRQLREEAAKRG